ncbi:hypothetical protein ACJ73_00563 [Blastomyces percursus]|uniref:Transcription factor domain-containing protein n=1 Tax=Blastomyces percursus TaxID=1658174 RepID=A0A1J9QHS6_9EURO|nr:hypothetical protein ACJ73_00563 [Blastomyces percursus]
MPEPAKELSRSIAPPTASRSNLPLRYKFIDASTNSPKSLASVKRHVMLEYARHKKWQERQRQDTGGEGDTDIDTSEGDKTQCGEQNLTQLPSLDPDTYWEYQNLEIADEVGLEFGADYFDKRGVSSWDPFAGLGLWESPPFWTRQLGDEYQSEANDPRLQSNTGSLPISLDEEGKMLFDFYANIMPSCSYGFHTRSSNAHNWYLQVFIPVAMKGDITFQNTILVHAANTQAWVKGLSETRAALVHRARGIEMLRKHFEKHPTDVSIAAISATLSCAAVEDFDPRPERKLISWIHMRAAMQKIRVRGGPAVFQKNQRMAMLINWQDYILAGYETNGPSFFYEDTPAHMQNSSNQMLIVGNQSFTPLDEIRFQCEEFISFLHRCERLSLTQTSSRSALNPTIPSRYSAFQPGTLLFQILSSPPGIRYSIPGERKQIISRLAALMTINVALWDYCNLPHMAETFLNGLQRKLLTSEVDVSSSVEALLQILLACDDTFGLVSDGYEPLVSTSQETGTTSAEPIPSERRWFVGRMLKIAKRLGRPSWEQLNDSLLSFLALTVEAPILPSWENDLRHEILTVPLTSYIMPLLL